MTDSVGTSFLFQKSVPKLDPTSLKARLASANTDERETARLESYFQVGYNPEHDLICAVDPGVRDIYTAVFFENPEELVEDSDKRADVFQNVYLPDLENNGGGVAHAQGSFPVLHILTTSLDLPVQVQDIDQVQVENQEGQKVELDLNFRQELPAVKKPESKSFMETMPTLYTCL
jgi:hypothetical protein